MAASQTDAGSERETVVTLARRAGVAASTVSRALRGDPRISVETRQRIASLASATGYMPNALARTLSSGRSGLIGLVLGSVENPFYAELMEEAVSQASARGLRLLLLHAGAGPIEDRTADALLHYKVDGCLITSAALSSHAGGICAAHGVPVVMVNRVPLLHASAVACDNFQGGQAIADLLRHAGLRRFAVVRGNPDSSTSLERERGFVEQLRAAGLGAPLRLDGGSTHQGGFAAGQAIAAMPARQRPDAVFAVADIMAIGVIDAVRLAGLAVPDEISVAGFDGIAAAARPAYRLTTVSQPLPEMVSRALDLLAARIGKSGLPDETVLLRGTLARGLTVRSAA